MPSAGVPTLSPSPSMTIACSSRLDDIRALSTAHPLGDHHRLDVDVLEAVALHLLCGPLNGAFELRRPAEAVSERVGEHREPLPGERVRGGLGDQPRRRLAIVSEPAWSWSARECFRLELRARTAVSTSRGARRHRHMTSRGAVINRGSPGALAGGPGAPEWRREVRKP